MGGDHHTMIKSKIGIILTGTALALITQGCSSGSQPVAASSSATDSSATSIAAPTTTSTTTAVVASATSSAVATGLPAYTTPPPDDQGNPPCEFGVGWQTFYQGGSGTGTYVSIDKTNVFTFNSRYIVLPDHYTVVVQTKDGHKHTQNAFVGEGPGIDETWDSIAEKDFIFANVLPEDVNHVFMTTSKGTCWVDGRP